MDRVFIKPTTREIVLQGKPEDGQADVFSYNYEGSSSNNLGSLFIVGHVQPATEDTSYMINLVSSLAKREYYAQPDTLSKDSFSKTLKKINEVLQDFFRDKDTKINIGIFTVAGENIFISRLGKFKIVLARNNENIDILNNINLFNKEHIQEKEFSNIISGKIMPGDKIFAFYPGRSITARERNIKADLLKLGAEDFAEKLGAIRKDNENFLCVGIHISINKHSEPAIVIPPQPRELRSDNTEVILAKTTKTAGKSAATLQELPSMRPSKVNLPEKIKPIATEEPLSVKTKSTPSIESKFTEPPPKSNVYYPGNQNVSVESPLQSKPNKPEPSPIIRPSEFSSAKKETFLNIIFKKYKPSGIYTMGRQPFMSKNKLILTASLTAVIIAVGILVKLTLMPSLPIPGIESKEDKAANAILKQAKSQLELAKGYKDQNNIFEARRTLLESLSLVATSTTQDEDLQTAKKELVTLLDEIDKAVNMSPSLLYQIAQEIGNGSLMTFAKNKLLVYSSDPTVADSGVILTTTENGVETTNKVSDFNPLYLIGGEKLAIMISKLSGPHSAGGSSEASQIGSLTFKTGDFKTSSLAPSGTIINVYPYQDNLYLLVSDNIYKIIDAANGKNTAVSWLDKDVFLPPQPALITVDSKIYIMTKNGYLATYYKGNKQSEVNTSISVNSESSLLTTKESAFLYLVDKKMGRIYVLSKSSGSLEKTIKLNNDQSLVSTSISDSGTIYLLTADNKVWKVVP